MNESSVWQSEMELSVSGNDLWFDESGDELRDDEFPDDNYDDDLNETIPCPECRAEVYEDAEQCPHCGHYITSETNVWSGRPAWWIVLGILGVAALILALLFYI